MSTTPLTPRAQHLLNAIFASIDGTLETWLDTATQADGSPLSEDSRQYCRERVDVFINHPCVDTLTDLLKFSDSEAKAVVDAYFAETEEAEEPASADLNAGAPVPEALATPEAPAVPEVAEPATDLGASAQGVAAATAGAVTQANATPLAEAIAEKFVKLGGHVIFFPCGTKRCTVSGWQELATNDLNVALAWAARDPYANVGLVGKQNGLWALDIDDPTIQAEIDALERAHGPINTYRTRTVSGGQHLIFRQTAASWAMGNVSVKDENNAESLSARVDDRYVVLAGSWAHPHNDESLSLTQYTAVDPNVPVAEAPQWLLDFIVAKGGQSNRTPAATATQSLITEVSAGGRNNHLASVAGRMRQAFGWDYEKIKEELLLENENKCKPPLPESEVDSIARSISGYEQKPGAIVLDQRPDPDSPADQQVQAVAQLDAWLASNEQSPDLASSEVVVLVSRLNDEEFEDRRSKVAKKLGWRSSALDAARAKAMVKEEEDDLQGRAFVLEETEPWQEPVNIAEVLNEIEKTLRRFVFFQREEDAYTVALWIAMTWLSAHLAITPYLGVRSPEKGCGKSTLLKLISKLVYHPLAASNCTAAAMFRMLELHVLTLVIDELDTFLEYNPEVLNVFNSGHSRELAFVLRCVGDDAEARAFNTFGAKAYGMIGNATDTLDSRSLSAILFPKIEEDGIEDLNLMEMPEVVTALQTLARKLARWANDNAQAVIAVKPDMKGTVNRKRDNWRPLFQTAEFAGHGWLDKARKAAGIKDVSEEKSVNRQFLEDVRNIFLKRNVPFVPSNVLLADLHAQHESGWKQYGKGRDGMTQNDLGIFMKGYGAKSSRDSLGGSRLRGYYWSDLAPAFNRFLRNVPPEDVDLGNVGMSTANAVDLNKPTGDQKTIN